jgi:hypothetical protein
MPLERVKQQIVRVETAQSSRAREEFGRLCRYVIEAVDSGVLTVQQGAYRICGTAARVPLPLTPEERRVVTAAGNLELPPDQQDKSLPDWNAFKALVAALFQTD